MTQPTPYTPTADFSAEEASNVGGRSSVRTAALDAELSAAALNLSGLNTSVALNQRDDGEIRDARVKMHTLAADVRALLTQSTSTVRGAWLTATVYALRDVVTNSTNTYICAVAHTSGTFATDLAAVKWVLLSLGAAVGAGAVSFAPTGTLAATNVQAAIEEADTEGRAASAAAAAAITALSLGLAAATGSSLVGHIASGVGAVARTVQNKLRDIVNAKDFGLVADGVTSDTAAILAAATALGVYGGIIELPAGTIALGSLLTLPYSVQLRGRGYSDRLGTGAVNRGATCLLRTFAGSSPLIILLGDDSGLDMLDVDGDLLGAAVGVIYPDNIVVTGSRTDIGTISTRNAAGDGIRYGMTTGQVTAPYGVNAGSNNCNVWYFKHILAYGNAGNGGKFDDTNTTISTSYPIGAPNVNGGSGSIFDAYGNGLDGLQFANCQDIVITFVTAQVSGKTISLTGSPLAAATSATLSVAWTLATGVYTCTFTEVGSVVEQRYVTLTIGATTATWATGLTANSSTASMVTGYGIHFRTDGTNSGPRCCKVVGNDSEANIGLDLLIDGATLPATAPGLYNVIFGNRAVALNSRITDNSTGSLVMQWNGGLSQRAYHFGSDLNVVNSSGVAGFNAYVGANLPPARMYATLSGTVDSIWKWQIHQSGGANVDCMELNQYGVFRPYYQYKLVSYSAAIAIDAATGCVFAISANNATAFVIATLTNPVAGQDITVSIRNTSAGALGAITWPANFKMTAWTSPAAGFSRSLGLYYDGTNWVEKSRTAADVPN